MNRTRLSLAASVVASLAGCETSGVGAGTGTGTIGAAVGPDEASVGVTGERVVAAAGGGRAGAGVRVGEGAPLVIGGGTPRGGGLFGGVGMGF